MIDRLASSMFCHCYRLRIGRALGDKINMTIQTAAFEVAANRRYLFIETRAFAFFWDFSARPVVNRKARC